MPVNKIKIKNLIQFNCKQKIVLKLMPFGLIGQAGLHVAKVVMAVCSIEIEPVPSPIA